MKNSNIAKAEKWWFIRTNSKTMKEDLSQGSDLSEEVIINIIDKFADMSVMYATSYYNELYSIFIKRHTKEIKDTKLARRLNKGKVLSFDGKVLRILHGNVLLQISRR